MAPRSKHKKREPMIGSVEAKNSRFRAVWYLDGKKQYKTTDTHDDACDFLDEMAIGVNRGGAVVDTSKPRTPFRVLGEQWHAARPQGREYAGSRGRERSALNKLYARFGDTPIGDITRKSIQLWINDITEDPAEDCAVCEDLGYRTEDDDARCEEHLKLKPLAASTVRDYYVVLGQVIRDAYLEGFGQHGALCPIGKGLHQLPRVSGRMICLTDDEVDHLLDVTKEGFLKHYAVIHLEAHTGLRQGELLGLQRDQYNSLGAFLYIDRALKRSPGNGAPFVGTTKTNRPRRVELLPCCVEVLNLHLTGHEERMIFPGETGRPQNTTNWRRRVWYPIRDAAGLTERGVHFHDLRHSHCSSLLAAGWEVTVVSERLGHKSTKMTLDRYGHAIAGRQQKLLVERGIRAERAQ